MREDEISYLIKIISNKVRAKGDMSLKKKGLTYSQMQLLFCLDNNSGKMSQKELEDKLDVAHPTVVGLVQRLEKSGYVKIQVDKNDKRKKVIVESKKAMKFKDEMFNRLHEFSIKMLMDLDINEKEELYRLLKIVSKRIDEVS